MKKIFIICCLILSSCSFFNKKTVELGVDSFPQGAEIYVNDQYHGVTPAVINIPPKDGFVTLNKRGYGTTSFKTPIFIGAVRTHANGSVDADGVRCILDMASVIFSFGEIDVRHVVYQFIIRQKFGTVDDYVTFLRPLLHTFFGKLTSRFPHNTFFMLQPIPTSNLKPYSSPTNVPAMTAYYGEFGDHPSLGSPEMRHGFWRCIDAMTSQICDE